MSLSPWMTMRYAELMMEDYYKKRKEPSMSDPIHPSHYQQGGLEVIQVIEAFTLNYNLGNVCKYVLRAGKKNDRLEDLKKAMWYLEREIDGHRT